MRCSRCNSEESETVTLWDGKEYCEECTGSVHKDLYIYAQRHETLSSDYREFSNRCMVWKLIRKEAIIGLFVVGLFVVLSIPAIFDANDVHDWIGRLIGVLLLFPLLCVIVFLLRSLVKPLTVSLVTSRHPQISIADGQVTLSSWSYNFGFPYRKNITLPLSCVKLQVLPLRHDIFFLQIAPGDKERYSLLDFSECVEEAHLGLCGQPAGMGIPYLKKRAWQANPYLCFTASRFENGILAAFFRLLGQSPACSEYEVFPTLTESAILKQQSSDGSWDVCTHTSGWAIAAGYVALFSVLCFPAPIALVLGVVALQDCNKHSLKGTGRAIFAIVMGSLFSLAFAWLIITDFLSTTG